MSYLWQLGNSKEEGKYKTVLRGTKKYKDIEIKAIYTIDSFMNVMEERRCGQLLNKIKLSWDIKGAVHKFKLLLP